MTRNRIGSAPAQPTPTAILVSWLAVFRPCLPRYIEKGAGFILSGQDASFMLAAAQSRTGVLRKTHGG